MEQLRVWDKEHFIAHLPNSSRLSITEPCITVLLFNVGATIIMAPYLFLFIFSFLFFEQ